MPSLPQRQMGIDVRIKMRYTCSVSSNREMATPSTEIEAKFSVQDLPALRKRVLRLGGQPQRPRAFERNLRFDTPSSDLKQQRAVLRLREDDAVRLTFKQSLTEFEHRLEFEFEVSDKQQAQSFLEALGYDVFFIYEKYRELISFAGCLLMLDDLPFGSFLEIEGPHLDAVKSAACQLNLDWSWRMDTSYLETFFALQKRFEFEAAHATFEALQGIDRAERVRWALWLADREESQEP